MCQFKSAIVIKDEREKGGFKLYMSPWTESHSEIKTMFNLRDRGQNLAKIEFSPENMDTAYLLDTYKLTIDEERIPSWFNDEMKELVTEKMTAYIKSIIVTGTVKLLIGGQFIIAPSAKVDSANNMVISAICGGTIQKIYGGTINTIWDGTIKHITGGTIYDIYGGTIYDIYGGTVENIYGGTIQRIHGGTILKNCK